LFSFENNVFWIAFVISVVCETVVSVLLVGKSFYSARHLRASSGLLDVMAKDGVGYYVCNLTITVANVVSILHASKFEGGILLIVQAILQSILCNRLLLHLHVVNAECSEPSSSEGHCAQVELRPLGTRRVIVKYPNMNIDSDGDGGLKHV